MIRISPLIADSREGKTRRKLVIVLRVLLLAGAAIAREATCTSGATRSAA